MKTINFNYNLFHNKDKKKHKLGSNKYTEKNNWADILE